MYIIGKWEIWKFEEGESRIYNLLKASWVWWKPAQIYI